MDERDDPLAPILKGAPKPAATHEEDDPLAPLLPKVAPPAPVEAPPPPGQPGLPIVDPLQPGVRRPTATPASVAGGLAGILGDIVEQEPVAPAITDPYAGGRDRDVAGGGGALGITRTPQAGRGQIGIGLARSYSSTRQALAGLSISDAAAKLRTLEAGGELRGLPIVDPLLPGAPISRPETEEELRDEWVASAVEIAKREKELADMPLTPASVRVLSGHGAPSDFIYTIAELGASSVLQSLPSIALGAGGAFLGGAPGAAAGAGAGSFITEYSAGLMDGLREQDIDLEDPEAVKAAMLDEDVVGPAHQFALKRGAVVAGVDLATFGILAKLSTSTIIRQLRGIRKAAAATGVVAFEVGGEMAGEAGAQLATTGKIEGSEVLAEGLGALGFQGPAAVAGIGAAAEARARRQDRGEGYFTRRVTPESSEAAIDKALVREGYALAEPGRELPSPMQETPRMLEIEAELQSVEPGTAEEAALLDEYAGEMGALARGDYDQSSEDVRTQGREADTEAIDLELRRRGYARPEGEAEQIADPGYVPPRLTELEAELKAAELGSQAEAELLEEYGALMGKVARRAEGDESVRYTARERGESDERPLIPSDEGTAAVDPLAAALGTGPAPAEGAPAGEGQPPGAPPVEPGAPPGDEAVPGATPEGAVPPVPQGPPDIPGAEQAPSDETRGATPPPGELGPGAVPPDAGVTPAADLPQPTRTPSEKGLESPHLFDDRVTLDRWEIDPGTIPGEPSHLLDINPETGEAAAVIVEQQNDQGMVLFEAFLADGTSLGTYATASDAAVVAEYHVGRQAAGTTETAPPAADLEQMPPPERFDHMRGQMPDVPERGNWYPVKMPDGTAAEAMISKRGQMQLRVPEEGGHTVYKLTRAGKLAETGFVEAEGPQRSGAWRLPVRKGIGRARLRKDGRVELVDAKGKPLAKSSRAYHAMAVEFVVENLGQLDDGERMIPTMLDELGFAREVASQSDNPVELLETLWFLASDYGRQAYQGQGENFVATLLDQLLGKKRIDRASFDAMVGSAVAREDKVMRLQWLTSEGGREIADLAREMSSFATDDANVEFITPEQIVEHILANPRREKDITGRKKDIRDLRHRIEMLTGVDMTAKDASDVLTEIRRREPTPPGPPEGEPRPPSEEAPFRRVPGRPTHALVPTAAQRGRVRSFAADYARDTLLPGITIVSRPSELPASLRRSERYRQAIAEGQVIPALYSGGVVYMIADEVVVSARLAGRSIEAETARLYNHEVVVHLGLPALLGKSLHPTLEGIFRVVGPERMQSRGLVELYSADLEGEASDPATWTDRDKRLLAEEYMAHAAEEQYFERGVVRSIYRNVRLGLKRALGITPTYADVRLLSELSAERLRRGGRAPGRDFARRLAAAVYGEDRFAVRPLDVRARSQGNFAETLPRLADTWRVRSQLEGLHLAPDFEAARAAAAEEWEGLADWHRERATGLEGTAERVAGFFEELEKEDLFARPELDEEGVRLARRTLEAAKTGRPLEATLYHGAPQPIEGELKASRHDVRWRVEGEPRDVKFGAVYLTSEEDVAATYGEHIATRRVELDNPKVIGARGQTWDDFAPFGKLVDAYVAGHDGLVIRNLRDDAAGEGEPSTIVVVFEGRGRISEEDTRLARREYGAPDLGSADALVTQTIGFEEPPGYFDHWRIRGRVETDAGTYTWAENTDFEHWEEGRQILLFQRKGKERAQALLSVGFEGGVDVITASNEAFPVELTDVTGGIRAGAPRRLAQIRRALERFPALAGMLEAYDVRFARRGYTPKEAAAVIERAVKIRGLTDEYERAGFVLPDGRMLDMWDEVSGYRDYHASVFLGEDVSEEEWLGLNEILEAGAIRFGPEDNVLEIWKKPTPKQFVWLSEMMAEFGTPSFMDLNREDGRETFLEFDQEDVSPKEALSAIRRFFAGFEVGGRTPRTSMFARRADLERIDTALRSAEKSLGEARAELRRQETTLGQRRKELGGELQAGMFGTEEQTTPDRQLGLEGTAPRVPERPDAARILKPYRDAVTKAQRELLRAQDEATKARRALGDQGTLFARRPGADASPEHRAVWNAAQKIKEDLWDAGVWDSDAAEELDELIKLAADGEIERMAGGMRKGSITSIVEEAMERAGDRRTVEEVYNDELENVQDDPDYDLLEEYEPGGNIFDFAVAAHGTTTDFNRAGYILPDGRMLDLSTGSPARVLDHRSVQFPVRFLDDDLPGVSGGRLTQMKRSGAIRIIGRENWDIGRQPTAAQYRLMQKALEEALESGPDVYVDLAIPQSQIRASRQFSGEETRAGEIIAWIRAFYRGEDVKGLRFARRDIPREQWPDYELRPGEPDQVREMAAEALQDLELARQEQLDLFRPIAAPAEPAPKPKLPPGVIEHPVPKEPFAFGGRILARAISHILATGETAPLTGSYVKTIDDVAVLAQVFRDPRYERSRFLWLRETTGGYTIVGQSGMTARLPSVTPVFPTKISEAVRAAPDVEAANVIYGAYIDSEMARTGATHFTHLHNHPGGNVEFSNSDTAMFRRLAAVGGRRFIGALVINSGKYATYERGSRAGTWLSHANSFVPGYDLGALAKGGIVRGVDLLEDVPSIPHPLLNESFMGFRDLVAKAKQLESEAPGQAVAIGMDADGRVRLLQEIPDSFFDAVTDYGDLISLKVDEARRLILEFARDSGVSTVALANVPRRYRHQAANLVDESLVMDVLLEREDATLRMQGIAEPYQFGAAGLGVGRVEEQFARRRPKPGPLQPLPQNPIESALEKEFGVPRETFTPDVMESQATRNLELEDQALYGGPPVSASELVKQMEKVLRIAGQRTPIKTGGKRILSRSALGAFWIKPEMIRLREANSIETAAHEMGHALEKAVFGWQRGSPWQKAIGVDKKMQDELHALGKALYGDRKPNGGYRREGWAEFIAYWTFNPFRAQFEAPTFFTWYEDTFLKSHPKVAEGLLELQAMATKWNLQGAEKRMQASIQPHRTLFAKVADWLRSPEQRAVTKTNVSKAWVTEFSPILRLVERAEELRGKDLPIRKNPFLTAEALGKTHETRARRMVRDAMIDFSGNEVGRSLQDVAAMVEGRRGEFTRYVWARRALKLWAGREAEYDDDGNIIQKAKEPRNPGISERDARYIFELYNTPEFRKAAAALYEWNDGVLNYTAAAFGQELVDQVKGGDVGDYIPLQRVFDDLNEMAGMASRRGGVRGGDPIKSLKGSGRRIRDPFEAMIEGASRMVRATHERYILNQMLALRHIEGIGNFIFELDPGSVPHSISVRQLIDELEGLNLAIEETAPGAGLWDAWVTFYTPQQFPKGQNPVMPFLEDGKVKWFELDETLYRSLQGLDIARFNASAIGRTLNIVFGIPARTFRLGTTGIRASFALFTNPARDLQTFYAQSRTMANPIKMFGAYVHAFKQAIDYAATGNTERSPYLTAFMRLGGEISRPLGVDTNEVARAAREIFQGKVVRIVSPANLFDNLRDLFQIPESATRAAELELVAKKLGWTPGTPMTEAQALEMLLAAKRVTTDFSSQGELAKQINLMVPFVTATIGGQRAFLRAFQQNPVRAIIAAASIVALTLSWWWLVKDEEWYRDMPTRYKLTYWFFPVGDEVVMIPRPHEWGLLFGSVPEALADAIYAQDPEQARDLFAKVFDDNNPLDLPVPVSIAAEQIAGDGGRDFFFDRPIVPKAELKRPPEQQFGPYTTTAAIELGRIFGVSPRRIDHAIRGLFGGVGADAAESLDHLFRLVGVERELSGAEWEFTKSDLPVIGRAFRRGGEAGSDSKAVDELYDLIEEAHRRQHDMRREETDAEREVRLMLEDAQMSLSVLYAIRSLTTEQQKRNEIMVAIRREARSAVDTVKLGQGEIARKRRELALMRRVHGMKNLPRRAELVRQRALERVGTLTEPETEAVE